MAPILTHEGTWEDKGQRGMAGYQAITVGKEMGMSEWEASDKIPFGQDFSLSQDLPLGAQIAPPRLRSALGASMRDAHPHLPGEHPAAAQELPAVPHGSP